MTYELLSRQDVDVVSVETEHRQQLTFSTLLYKYRLFTGVWSQKQQSQLLELGDAVSVVLYDPGRDSVVLVEQFRPGAIQSHNPWLLELVGGVVEENEAITAVAAREVNEETGLLIAQPELVYQYYSTPGVSTEKVSLLYAECDSYQVSHFAGLESEGEDIRVHVVTRKQVIQWLHERILREVNTILGLQWLCYQCLSNKIR